MKYLIYVTITLAALHYIYEGILAPSFRLRLRFKMFALRDRLRKLKIERGDELRDEVFNVLQASINNTTTLLHRTTVDVIRRAESDYQHDPALRRRIDRRIAIVESCDMPEVKEILKETRRALTIAVLVNHGGWGIYVVPFLALIFCLARLKDFVLKATAFPDYEVERLVPTELHITVA